MSKPRLIPLEPRYIPGGCSATIMKPSLAGQIMFALTGSGMNIND